MSNLGLNILFLDDDEERVYRAKRLWPACTVVNTAKDCIAQLQRRTWVTVLLDHDLGGEQMVDSKREDCGMEVVRWICDNRPAISEVVIHSFNTPASVAMYERLKHAGYDVHRIPFGSGPLWKSK